MSENNRDFIEQHKTPKQKIKVLNAMGLSEASLNDKDLSPYDKRRWLILKDFWLDRITQDHANELLKEVARDERDRQGSEHEVEHDSSQEL